LRGGGVDNGGNEDTPSPRRPDTAATTLDSAGGRPKPLLAVAGVDGGEELRKEEAEAARRVFFIIKGTYLCIYGAILNLMY
jgi:hypothetical protein